ncbi:MAG: hypothetical protein WA159_02950 [Variovorax sp.]
MDQNEGEREVIDPYEEIANSLTFEDKLGLVMTLAEASKEMLTLYREGVFDRNEGLELMELTNACQRISYLVKTKSKESAK